MSANHLTELDDQTLIARLAEHREELFNLRFQNATGQLTNSAHIGQVKREIARCLTETRRREIEAAEALAANQETV